MTTKFEVTNGQGELHTVDFWSTAKQASDFASQGKAQGYRAFGLITIDDADTPVAKKVESCLQ